MYTNITDLLLTKAVWYVLNAITVFDKPYSNSVHVNETQRPNEKKNRSKNQLIVFVGNAMDFCLLFWLLCVDEDSSPFATYIIPSIVTIFVFVSN